jgi:phosphoesterase RecJ-like protein
MFTERKGRVRMSFRSIGDFPANQLSKKYFNGGGHINAAGGSSESSLEETVDLFLKVLPEFKDLLNQ